MRIQQKLVVFFSLFFVVLVAGCSAPQDPIETIQNQEGVDTTTQIPNEGTISQNEIIIDDSQRSNQQDSQQNLDEVLVRVNGEEVIREEVIQAQQLLMMQGQQVTQEDALNQVIAQTLLLQDIKSQGIEVGDEEALELIEQELALQGLDLDQYREELESQGLSFQNELENFKQGVAFDNYIEQLVSQQNLEISEEQVQEFYQNLQIEMENQLPPLEEIQEQVIELIQSQFEQEILNLKVQELQEEAEIEFI